MKSIFTVLLLGLQSVFACTALQLKADDGATIYCRSMEYGYPLKSGLLIVPRATAFTGTTPTNKPGFRWKTQYGYVGMNQAINKRLVSDGMNEKGLVVGSLYLYYAEYEKPDPARTKETLGAWELTSFLLGTCTSVDEVKEALSKVLVAHEPIPEMDGFVIPLHFYVTDRTGAALVIEYVGGVRHVYDNPIGVLTNAPNFDWQLTNLSNYLNTSPYNAPRMTLKNMEVLSYGQGTGLQGLPGDFTPVSRFVRAAFFAQFALPQKTAINAVALGFHILNTFDLFEGAVRRRPDQKPKGPKGSMVSDIDTTQWTIVHDTQNLKTYFRSYGSLRIEMADLTKLDFQAPGLREIPLSLDFTVDEVTSTAKPLQALKNPPS